MAQNFKSHSIGTSKKCWTWWRHEMKTFPRHWPIVRGIHWSPVDSPHKGRRRGAFMFSLICARTNHRGDLGRHRADYDVIVMRTGRNWQQMGNLQPGALPQAAIHVQTRGLKTWQICFVPRNECIFPVLSCYHIGGLVQEKRNSIANALELRLFCTNPSIIYTGTLTCWLNIPKSTCQQGLLTNGYLLE